MRKSEGPKSPFGAASAFLAGSAFGFLSWCGCLAGVARISEATHSGLLGICGPYGDHVGLVTLSFLASIPFSVIAGVWFGNFVLRRIQGTNKANPAQQTRP
jgi:hypothetical protein